MVEKISISDTSSCEYIRACSEIRFEQEGKLGLITLTRAKALNALNLPMILALHSALKKWELDERVEAILIEGEGRAFCSGGDIVSLYNDKKEGRDPKIFFDKEYDLNAYIKRYPKPFIAFLDGIVMGGGAGISMHGSHRIATKNTLFAMPEAAIGLFADVGANSFLAHLPLPLILFICLTGWRFKWGDCLMLKLATHAIEEENYPRLKQALIEEGNPDKILEEISISPAAETPAEIFERLEECFSNTSFEDCRACLCAFADGGDETAQKILQNFSVFSPISLKLIFTYMQLYRGSDYVIEDIMALEKYIAYQLMDKHDFFEGVRAALIDKDQTPDWSIKHVEDVSKEYIKTYFPE